MINKLVKINFFYYYFLVSNISDSYLYNQEINIIRDDIKFFVIKMRLNLFLVLFICLSKNW